MDTSCRLLPLLFGLFFTYVSASTTNTVPAPSCDTDGNWREFNEKCYYMSDPTNQVQITWYDASDWCMQNGGNLASIESDDERQFIYNMSRAQIYDGPRWIGLNDIADAKTWSWSDGVAVSYDAWHDGQPVDDGARRCAYQKHYPIDVCFEEGTTFDYVSELLEYPLQADGVDTFNFGQIYSDNCEECAGYCSNRPGCTAYTLYSYSYPESAWRKSCMGRSNKTQAKQNTTGVECSGEQTPCKGDGNWFNDNCGAGKGFVCKKEKGNDVTLTTPTTTAVPGGCPADYFGSGNKCYKIVEVKSYDAGLDWEYALAKCRDYPGILSDLASFHSDDEMAQLTMHLSENSIGFWIGYYRASDDFLWSDSSPADYVNWGGSHSPPDPNPTGNCAEIWTVPGPVGTWNNLNCDQKRGYICQTYKDPASIHPTPTPGPQTCPAGQTPYGVDCYKVQGVATTQADAEISCSFLGGHLASIVGATDNAAIYQLFTKPMNESLWIGLQQNTTSAEWGWTDGWPVYHTNWGVNQPDTSNPKYTCTLITPDGTWRTAACSGEYKPMCRITKGELPTPPPVVSGDCPDDSWAHYGGHCYHFSQYSGDSYTWEAGETKCGELAGVNFDGHLVSVHSYHENEYIRKQIQVNMNTWGIWIGLRQEDENSPHKWSDGSADQFEQFLPGEPDSTNNQFCIEMLTTANGYKFAYWKSTDCSQHKPIACKAKKAPVATPPPPSPGHCPTDAWTGYGPSCLQVVLDPNNFLSQSEAAEFCQSKGGWLTSIRNHLETQLVQPMVLNKTKEEDDVWIGLERTSTEPDTYEWRDETPLEYQNWLPGNPQSGGMYQSCVLMGSHDGQWRSGDCRNQRGFICRAEKVVDVTTELPTTEEETTVKVISTSTTLRPSTSTTTTTTPAATRSEEISQSSTESTTDNQTTENTEVDRPTSQSLSGGAVAGIVVGVILGVGLLGTVGYGIYRYRQMGYWPEVGAIPLPDDIHAQNPSQYDELDDEASSRSGASAKIC